MESVVSGPKYLDPSDQAAEGGNQGRRRSQRERLEDVQANRRRHNSTFRSSKISDTCNSENPGRARLVLLLSCLSCLGLLTKLFVSEQQERVDTTSYLYNMGF